jgi:exosome complex component RRP4
MSTSSRCPAQKTTFVTAFFFFFFFFFGFFFFFLRAYIEHAELSAVGIKLTKIVRDKALRNIVRIGGLSEKRKKRNAEENSKTVRSRNTQKSTHHFFLFLYMYKSDGSGRKTKKIKPSQRSNKKMSVVVVSKPTRHHVAPPTSASTTNTTTNTETNTSGVILAGSAISSDATLRGHNTHVRAEDGALVASVNGVVERVNQLVSVRPLWSRYAAEVGDVVVGRVAEVAQTRWKVDVRGRQHASLLLSSINLPGSAQQRRRTHADALEMRKYFREGDVISAEVHKVHTDNSISLHSRSLKYNKLSRGLLVAVPPRLVQRSKTHFVILATGVEVILGMNGYIWVGAVTESADADANAALTVAAPLRRHITRTANLVRILADAGVVLHSDLIVSAVNCAGEVEPYDLIAGGARDAVLAVLAPNAAAALASGGVQ